MHTNTIHINGTHNSGCQTKNYSPVDVEMVKKRIREKIQSYRKREISLKELVRQVEVMRLQSNVQLTTKIEDIFSVLKSLSIIDDILTDILQELQE